MADALAPLTLPSLEGQVRVDDATDHPFELGPVSVVARTVVYEDAVVCERVPAIADGPWRLLLASHLEIRPHAPPLRSLMKLVGKCANTGFRSRLEARGFSDARRVESRALRVRVGGGGNGQRDAGRDDDTRGGGATESEADVICYAAIAEPAGIKLAVGTYLAVMPVDGEFLLASDTYPHEVCDGDGETAVALREAIEPEHFREELFRVIRGTGQGNEVGPKERLARRCRTRSLVADEHEVVSVADTGDQGT